MLTFFYNLSSRESLQRKYLPGMHKLVDYHVGYFSAYIMIKKDRISWILSEAAVPGGKFTSVVCKFFFSTFGGLLNILDVLQCNIFRVRFI